MPWYPKEDDLWPYIAKRMEEAYQDRERAKCSREDFFDGYLAALRDHLPRSAFKPGRREPDDTAAHPAAASSSGPGGA